MKKRNMELVLFSCAVLLSLMSFVQCDPYTEAQVCQTWKTFSQQMSSSAHRPWDGPGIHTNCKVHTDKCEQLDCGGEAHIRVLQEFNFGFCFGVMMHHCDRPPFIELTLQIPHLNTDLYKKITHNDSFDVPGLSMKYRGNKGTIVLFVAFQKKDDYHFTFTLSSKLRLTMSLLDEEETLWPEQFQQRILGPVSFPVTPCNKTTHNQLLAPKTCNPSSYIAGITTPKPADHTTVSVKSGPTSSNPGHTTGTTSHKTSTSTKPPVISGSKTYKKGCDYGNFRARDCGRNEVCKVAEHKAKPQATCQCAPDTKMSGKTGYCETTSGLAPFIPLVPIDLTSSTQPPQIAPHSSSDGKSSTQNNNALIIGCVVGGVVLVGIIVVVIVVVMRKRGAQYHGRQLLLTEDDTDGVI